MNTEPSKKTNPFLLSELRRQMDHQFRFAEWRKRSWLYRFFHKPPELWQLNMDYLPSDDNEDWEEQAARIRAKIEQYQAM